MQNYSACKKFEVGPSVAVSLGWILLSSHLGDHRPDLAGLSPLKLSLRFDSLRPINNLSVIKRRVFLG